jgi:hypothetical protein
VTQRSLGNRAYLLRVRSGPIAGGFLLEDDEERPIVLVNSRFPRGSLAL